MKNKLKILAFLFLLILSSCGPDIDEMDKESKKTANTFFSLVSNKKYQDALKLVDKSSTHFANPVKQFDLLREHPERGKLISGEACTGMSSTSYTVTNGSSSCRFCFNLIYEKGEYESYLTVINKGDGYKLFSIGKLTKNDFPF